MNQPPRKRRRRRPAEQPAEEEYQAPRRRKKKRSGTKQKKSTKPNVPIGFIAGIAGVVVVVLIAIMVVDWKSVGKTVGLSNTPESLMKRLLSYQNEQVDILASIQNEADAQAAGSKLIKNAEEMAKTSFEITQLQKAENIPIKDSLALKKEFADKLKPIAARSLEEIKRIGSNPALAATMRNIMMESGTARMRITNELRLNKAKKDANADGYSAVTSGTELTNGMNIEVLDSLNQWKKGKISDVRTDGKVKVSSFILYVNRDHLRIPD